MNGDYAPLGAPTSNGELAEILAAFPNVGHGPIDKRAYNAALRQLAEFSRRSANSAAGGVEVKDIRDLLVYEMSRDPREGSDKWTDTAEAVLSYLSSLHPTEGAEPVAWRWRNYPGGWQYTDHKDMAPAERAEALYAHPSSPVSAEVTGPFQDRVAKAHVALFHDDPTDVAERRDRFYEEATEAAQSFGMTEAEAHALVAYTFSRPVGAPEKEIGASALTLASLCVEAGYDMMACAEADLAALVTPEKIAKVRAKRATRHGRGPLPGLDASIDGGRENG